MAKVCQKNTRRQSCQHAASAARRLCCWPPALGGGPQLLWLTAGIRWGVAAGPGCRRCARGWGRLPQGMAGFPLPAVAGWAVAWRAVPGIGVLQYQQREGLRGGVSMGGQPGSQAEHGSGLSWHWLATSVAAQVLQAHLPGRSKGESPWVDSGAAAPAPATQSPARPRWSTGLPPAALHSAVTASAGATGS